MESESAFGRPAQWLAALPALIVGCGAMLIAAYGTWALPAKLPQQYADALQESEREYDSIYSQIGPSGDSRLSDVAGERDVIYSRLIALEQGSPKRYWEWATFLEAHAANVRRLVNDPASSVREDVREQLGAEAQRYEEKARSTLEQMVAGNSQFRAKALVRLATDKYKQGMAQFGVSDAAELAGRLQQMLEVVDESSRRNADEAAELSPQELDVAWRLLVELTIEAAWQNDTGSRLVCDQAKLNEAWQFVRQAAQRGSPTTVPEHDRSTDAQNIGRSDTGTPNHSLEAGEGEAPAEPYVGPDTGTPNPSFEEEDLTLHSLQWKAARRLLEAYREKPLADDLDSTSAASDASSGHDGAPDSEVSRSNNKLSNADWTERLADLQLACLDGNWHEVAFLLSTKADADDPPVSAGMSRTICRLACSPFARDNEEWCGKIDAGLLLVAQLAPHLPEFSELIWECAMTRAGPERSEQVVAAKVPMAIATGQSGLLKHSVFAFASMMDDHLGVARTHLELIKRSRGSLMIVARTGLWRVQMLPPDAAVEEFERLAGLLEAVAELEPESGLNWFALGAAQLRGNRHQAAVASLEKARELLGNVAAIDELLSGIR